MPSPSTIQPDSRRRFYHRFLDALFLASSVIGVSLLLGILGYHFVARFSWIDSLLNASMILSGMGPVKNLNSDAAKVFASCYALFSGVVFISATGILLAPMFHRVLHRFHHRTEGSSVTDFAAPIPAVELDRRQRRGSSSGRVMRLDKSDDSSMRSSSHSRPILEWLIEAALVGVGVFLGLLANQWHEDRQHRELADATLRYFHEEILANKRAIERVRPYHATLSREVGRFLQAEGPRTTATSSSRTFTSAGWSRWSLNVLPGISLWRHSRFPICLRKLAYAISRVYTRQQTFQTLQNGFLQAILAPTTFGART